MPYDRQKAFQSTLPVWGGTVVDVGAKTGLVISIHPPRVGRDVSISVWFFGTFHFNPPSPCGEGRKDSLPSSSTTTISIHPPRVGRDRPAPFAGAGPCYFNPPSPCGEGRGYHKKRGFPHLGFQSTLPVWGGTLSQGQHREGITNFNPPSPCGEGPLQPSGLCTTTTFQSTLPVWGGT